MLPLRLAFSQPRTRSGNDVGVKPQRRKICALLTSDRNDCSLGPLSGTERQVVERARDEPTFES